MVPGNVEYLVIGGGGGGGGYRSGVSYGWGGGAGGYRTNKPGETPGLLSLQNRHFLSLLELMRLLLVVEVLVEVDPILVMLGVILDLTQ